MSLPDSKFTKKAGNPSIAGRDSSDHDSLEANPNAKVISLVIESAACSTIVSTMRMWIESATVSVDWLVGPVNTGPGVAIHVVGIEGSIMDGIGVTVK